MYISYGLLTEDSAMNVAEKVSFDRLFCTHLSWENSHLGSRHDRWLVTRDTAEKVHLSDGKTGGLVSHRLESGCHLSLSGIKTELEHFLAEHPDAKWLLLRHVSVPKRSGGLEHHMMIEAWAQE